jgi:hypothetical protein
MVRNGFCKDKSRFNGGRQQIRPHPERLAQGGARRVAAAPAVDASSGLGGAGAMEELRIGVV